MLALFWKHALQEASDTLSEFLRDPEQIKRCCQFSEILIETFQQGGNVFSCGNGGSHCDAMHFAEEWTGRFRKDRRPLGALALGDLSHITCVGNDYGFSHIFSRQLEGLGRSGDLLIGFSTSGNSENVYQAFLTAQKKNLRIVALLGQFPGRPPGRLQELADLAILIPGKTSDRIQEMHIKLVHTVIETTERVLFPELYPPS